MVYLIWGKCFFLTFSGFWLKKKNDKPDAIVLCVINSAQKNVMVEEVYKFLRVIVEKYLKYLKSIELL